MAKRVEALAVLEKNLGSVSSILLSVTPVPCLLMTYIDPRHGGGAHT